MQGGALDIAVADRELFRQSAGLLHKRIVDRDPPVVMQADHRPGVVVKALCPLLVTAIAEGDEQKALPIEHQARAEVASAVRLGEHPEQNLHVAERLSLQPGTEHLGAVAAFSFGDVGEIDPAVVTKSGVQGHIEQPALADRGDRWQSTHGFRIEPAIGIDQPQAARALADQHSSVRQKGEAPGVFETFGENRQPDALPFAFENLGEGGQGPEGAKQQPSTKEQPMIWQDELRR